MSQEPAQLDSDQQLRNRFLVALAKFLGESPTEPSPLSTVQLCEDWFLEELLRPLLEPPETIKLTIEVLNRFMINCGRRICSPHFYSFFFRGVRSIQDFELAVEDFRIRAIWLFGNFRYAYRVLATAEEAKFKELIGRTLKRSPDEFEGRLGFTEIQPIPEEDLGFLGYVSSGELKDFDTSVASLKSLLSNWAERDDFLTGLGPKINRRLFGG
jgi:hypothetical protein